MSNVTNLGSRVQSLEKSNLYLPYSKVILNVSDDVSYTVGDDTGRTMEVDCPFGTEGTARGILAKLQGYRHQPVKASSADLDPAAEIGDVVSVGNVVSRIYNKSISFGSMYTADVSSPGEEKVNYQYPYKSPEQRKIARTFKSFRSEFRVQADRISAEVEARESDVKAIKAVLTVQSDNIDAKVSKTGGESSSFGWNLQVDNWSVYSGGTAVFKVTKDVAEFAGKILAKSGEIGGFEILSDHLSTNGKTWGVDGSGVYLGSQGIQIGDGFKADSAGNGWFAGTVRAGKIEYGGTSGYFSGAGISSRSIGGGRIALNTITGGASGNIAINTLTTNNTSEGINTSLGYADFTKAVLEGTQYMATIHLRSGTFMMNNHNVYLGEIYVDGTKLNVLRWN